MEGDATVTPIVAQKVAGFSTRQYSRALPVKAEKARMYEPLSAENASQP